VRRWAACLLAICFAPAALLAQELRGTVLLDGTEQPAAGVIIEARDPATDIRILSTLTDSRGYFILKLPAPTTVLLRGLRIGQRPTEFGTFTLAADEVRTERFTLSGTAVVLDYVRVVGRSVCGRARARDAQVVTLLEEARKAIQATQLRSTDGELSAIWTLRSQQTTLAGRPVAEPSIQAFRASTERPFQSIPPDSLAAVGYLEIAEDGYTFFAPDAEVLLSEEFVEGHCFQAQPWTKDDRDWVGIGFRPAQTDRGIVNIRGTMWLDRRSAELRLLEFEYLNLPPILRVRNTGGEVAFLRLPTGSWLVHKWHIRMPRVTQTEVPTRFGRRTGNRTVSDVKAMEVYGGDVREIRRGEELVFAAESAAEIEIERAAADIASLCTEAPDASHAVVWGVLRDSSGAPVRAGTVTLAWRDDSRWLAGEQPISTPMRVEAATGTDGFWLACGVARAAPITVHATAGDARSPEYAAEIPADSLGVELALRLSVSAGTVSGTVFGRFVDSLRTAQPSPSADVRVLGGPQRATTDDAGRFAIDGLPPGEHEVVVWDDDLRLLGIDLPRVRVRVDVDGSAEPALLATPSATAYFTQVCGRAPIPGEGLLVGELRDLSGGRRAGVPVRADWTRSLLSRESSERDERTVEGVSDARGWYALCGVPTDGEVDRSGAVTVYASGEVQLRAADERFSSGTIGVWLEGASIKRRDLILGGATDRRQLGGVVRDQLSRPIAGATVLMLGEEELTARTDSTGAWTMRDVPVRSSQMMIRALGYQPLTFDLDPIDGRFSVGEVRLNPAPQVLATVNIRGIATNTSEAGFEERRKGYGFGTFIDESVLKRQPMVTANFISSRTPRTRVSGGGALLIEQAGSGMQAFTACAPRWFVDGVDWGKNPDDQQQLFNRAVRIEIYRSSLAPPQFNDFDGCGTVVIWTR
jgi:hypothetical protein